MYLFHLRNKLKIENYLVNGYCYNYNPLKYSFLCENWSTVMQQIIKYIYLT
jgi:hypothetical protein